MGKQRRQRDSRVRTRTLDEVRAFSLMSPHAARVLVQDCAHHDRKRVKVTIPPVTNSSGSMTVKLPHPTRLNKTIAPNKPPDFLLKLLRMFEVRAVHGLRNDSAARPTQEVPEFTTWQFGKILVSPPPSPAEVGVRFMSSRTYCTLILVAASQALLKRYFRSTKFTSFQRQLTNVRLFISLVQTPL